MVNVEAPAVFGVPEIVLPLSVSPAGSVPAARLNVCDPLPPVADSVALYGIKVRPLISVGGLTVMVGQATFNMKLAVVVAPQLSVTTTLMV